MADVAADDSFILDDKQLDKLAKVVYKQEEEAALHYKGNSEFERSDCIQQTKVCYNTVLGLLESVRELKKEYDNGDKELSSIANDIFSYVVYAVNNALQFVSNYSLRKHYLDKISENVEVVRRALQETGRNNEINAGRLAKDAKTFRNAMLEYVRLKSRPVSRNLARDLKETGLSFRKLVQRYQDIHNLQGEFRNLQAAEKLQVYNSIIEASGRGRVTVNQVSTALGATGMAVLIFTAAIAVWDVYTSDDKLQTAARNGFQSIGAVGGGTLGEYAAAALATRSLGAGASPLFVVAAGIVGGIAGSYILGEFAVRLVDYVFGCGDTDNINHLNDEIHLHKCCVAPAPQGFDLARPLANHDKT